MFHEEIAEWWLDQDDGLLVVHRQSPSGHSNSLQRSFTFSKNEHTNFEMHYRGFEGAPWPDLQDSDGIQLVNGLASPMQYSEVKEYVARFQERYIIDLIYCQFGASVRKHPPIPKNFSLCGYDYGFYESEWSSYSAIYNEVLYGRYLTMRSFSQHLNDCFLLPSLNLVEHLDQTRSALLAEGNDLERARRCIGIAIHVENNYR